MHSHMFNKMMVELGQGMVDTCCVCIHHSGKKDTSNGKSTIVLDAVIL